MTTGRSAEAVLDLIHKFVLRQRGELPAPITLDTRLVDDGLVDSFGLVDLGMEISRALDIPLSAGNLLPEDFETPRILWDRIQELSA